MTKRLYLVRHGETPMNVARQLQGITDANLTAKGRDAADRLGELLRPIPFVKAFSSDRERAIETARRIIAGHQPQPALIKLSALREYYFGGLEGDPGNAVMTRTIRRYGLTASWRAWVGSQRFAGLIRSIRNADPTHQAEDLPDLLVRVRQAFAQIDTQSPDNSDILVVSHGLLLSALIYQLAPEQLPLGLLKNTSVTRVDVTDKGMRLRGVNLIRESDILALRMMSLKKTIIKTILKVLTKVKSHQC
ncbi:histidine phosphatase family protein [Lacticaseibacillus rhamnosus]|uniref:histidine phosphatase family protein n=1 Tax=Lacticaseibacillus rhamnosus TaxID=47715 RepID=UPI000468FA73|nr:histidine phosphatase family protein [Lacticaseibacillus rhamnosus]